MRNEHIDDEADSTLNASYLEIDSFSTIFSTAVEPVTARRL